MPPLPPLRAVNLPSPALLSVHPCQASQGGPAPQGGFTPWRISRPDGESCPVGVAARLRPFRIVQGLGLLLVTLIAACDSPPPIRTYEIRTDVPPTLAGDERMLGLMVPEPDSAWFFKVVGPKEAIRYAEAPIRDFLGKVRFAEGKPDLKELPQGWVMGTERPMRFATLLIDTPTRELEMSISQLPRSEKWDEQVALNVNRWRGQMGLEDSTDPLAGAEKFALTSLGESPDSPAWVDLAGRMNPNAGAMPGAGGMPPFASGGPPGAGPPSAGPPSAGPPDQARPSQAPPNPGPPGATPTPADNAGSTAAGPKFVAPPEWRAGKMSMMRLAAFQIGPTDRQAELTIIQAGGDLRGNVDRWLGQVLGGPAPADVVDKSLADAQKLSVSGREAQRFFLSGGDDKPNAQGIDATIVSVGDGMSLFIKATGPAETLGEERERIGKFLESIRLDE